MYLHWSKKIAIGLLVGFGIVTTLLLAGGNAAITGSLQGSITTWILVNYVGVIVWLFVWIGDQARMRGRNVWFWLAPLILAPLPTIGIFILYYQKRMQ
jgi:hypothetical protein